MLWLVTAERRSVSMPGTLRGHNKTLDFPARSEFLVVTGVNGGLLHFTK